MVRRLRRENAQRDLGPLRSTAARGRAATDAPGPDRLPEGGILQLQRSIGNRAVQQVLAGQQPTQRWLAGARPGREQGPPALGGARADARLNDRIAALFGGAPQNRRLAAESAAHEHAQSGAPTAPWVRGRRPPTEAELEARAAALRGDEPRDPTLLAEIAAYEAAHPEGALEARLASLKEGAAPELEVLAMQSAYEEAEGIAPEPGPPVIGAARADAAFQARVTALTGGPPTDPRLLGLIEARERAERGFRWTRARTPAGAGGRSLLAGPRERAADATLNARYAALMGGDRPHDPVLAKWIAALESDDPYLLVEARAASLTGRVVPSDPELLAQIAATEHADAERRAGLQQFSAGAALVETSLRTLEHALKLISHAMVACQSGPLGTDVLMSIVSQVFGAVATAKMLLDQGSDLLSRAQPGDTAQPGDPAQAAVLARGKRNIEEAKRLFYKIEPITRILQAMAPVDVAEQQAVRHQNLSMPMPPHIGVGPCRSLGLLHELQTSVIQAMTLVQTGLEMERVATRVPAGAVTDVEGLQFPAIPAGEQAAEPQPGLQFPEVPANVQVEEAPDDSHRRSRRLETPLPAG